MFRTSDHAFDMCIDLHFRCDAVQASAQTYQLQIKMPPKKQNPSKHSRPNYHRANRTSDVGSTVLGAIPALGLVLLAIVAIELGAAIATHLFPLLGPESTVAYRIIFAALLLVAVARGQIWSFGHTFVHHWALLVPFGLCIAAMNMFFYKAIALIPLGVAVALEFIGPLGVAAFTSRKLIHFAWIALACIGIVLLSPLSGMNLNTHGVVYALLAGAGWAFFILLATRISNRVSGNNGLAIGMCIAAICMIPFAAPLATTIFVNPLLLIATFGVALLSTTIPFTLEFAALKRLSTRTYGVLVSVEPAVAALIGTLLLGEYLGIQSMIAIACVVIAAIGISVTDERNRLNQDNDVHESK